MSEIYHSGEREIQQKVGETLIANRNGAVITNTIIRGAINFIEKQPMVVVSSVNPLGEVWTSLLIGNFGFAKVPHPNAIVLSKDMIISSHDDIFFENIILNNQIGSLFIELDSRRRFRINGKCTINGEKIELEIDEAFPNCPKYIQRRVVSLNEHFSISTPTTINGNKLTPNEKKWISNADTFFVGSCDSSGKLDVNHRGGKSGFVEIIDEETIKIPDYQGNSLYNTLGNIVQNPNVGLIFIDFDKKQTIQLTGKAELLFEQKSEMDLAKTGGTGRYWVFKTERWIITENHHDVQWEFLDYSPFNP